MKSTKFLLDHDGKVGKTYGAKTTPHMFVIDKAGQAGLPGRDRQQSDCERRRSRRRENYVKVALESQWLASR